MKEQLISFETAKLAKKKGFNWCVLNHYEDELFKNKGYLFQDDVKNTELEHYEYSAPTQSLLQKWLREEHGIYVTVMPDKSYDFGLLFNVVVKSDAKDYMYDLILRDGGKIMDLETHEQALEAGLIEALKLIK